MGTDVSQEPAASVFRVESTASCPEGQNCNNYCRPSLCFVLCFIVPISNDVRRTTEIQYLNLSVLCGPGVGIEKRKLPWLSAVALGFTGQIIMVKNSSLCGTEACDVIHNGVCV
jgi:hypothetical protein